MGATPQALLDRPVLMSGLDCYMVAYQELLHDRQVGMDYGTIPWSSIHRWAVFHGLMLPDDVAILEHHIRRLEEADRVFEKEGKPD